MPARIDCSPIMLLSSRKPNLGEAGELPTCVCEDQRIEWHILEQSGKVRPSPRGCEVAGLLAFRIGKLATGPDPLVLWSPSHETGLLSSFGLASPSFLRNKDRSVGPQRPERFRPQVECLEDRVAPATFNLTVNPSVNPTGAVTELTSYINLANLNGQANTINLFAGGNYTLTAINNYWYGPDGLPAISSTLTINGQGATIQRDSLAADFRFFYVSGGFDGLAAGNLTLFNLTLFKGDAQGGAGLRRRRWRWSGWSNLQPGKRNAVGSAAQY